MDRDYNPGKHFPSEEAIKRELAKHSFTIEEFRAEVKGKVSDDEVLAWLGE